MKVLVLGATGGTGREFVAQALAQGHDVTAFVRDPAKLAPHDARLRNAVGSLPEAREKLAEAVRGQDAVFSALGSGGSLKPHGLMTRSVPVIVETMERERVRRLIYMSSIGVGNRESNLPFVLWLEVRLLLKDIYADKAIGEDIIRKSTLDWTILHPTILTDGPKTGRSRAGEQLPLRGMPKISRAEVADFALRQLGDPTYIRKIVVISE